MGKNNPKAFLNKSCYIAYTRLEQKASSDFAKHLCIESNSSSISCPKGYEFFLSLTFLNIIKDILLSNLDKKVHAFLATISSLSEIKDFINKDKTLSLYYRVLGNKINNTSKQTKLNLSSEEKEIVTSFDERFSHYCYAWEHSLFGEPSFNNVSEDIVSAILVKQSCINIFFTIAESTCTEPHFLSSLNQATSSSYVLCEIRQKEQSLLNSRKLFVDQANKAICQVYNKTKDELQFFVPGHTQEEAELYLQQVLTKHRLDPKKIELSEEDFQKAVCKLLQEFRCNLAQKVQELTLYIKNRSFKINKKLSLARELFDYSMPLRQNAYFLEQFKTQKQHFCNENLEIEQQYSKFFHEHLTLLEKYGNPKDVFTVQIYLDKYIDTTQDPHALIDLLMFYAKERSEYYNYIRKVGYECLRSSFALMSADKGRLLAGDDSWLSVFGCKIYLSHDATFAKSITLKSSFFLLEYFFALSRISYLNGGTVLFVNRICHHVHLWEKSLTNATNIFSRANANEVENDLLQSFLGIANLLQVYLKTYQQLQNSDSFDLAQLVLDFNTSLKQMSFLSGVLNFNKVPLLNQNISCKQDLLCYMVNQVQVVYDHIKPTLDKIYQDLFKNLPVLVSAYKAQAKSNNSTTSSSFSNRKDNQGLLEQRLFSLYEQKLDAYFIMSILDNADISHLNDTVVSGVFKKLRAFLNYINAHIALDCYIIDPPKKYSLLSGEDRQKAREELLQAFKSSSCQNKKKFSCFVKLKDSSVDQNILISRHLAKTNISVSLDGSIQVNLLSSEQRKQLKQKDPALPKDWAVITIKNTLNLNNLKNARLSDLFLYLLQSDSKYADLWQIASFSLHFERGAYIASDSKNSPPFRLRCNLNIKGSKPVTFSEFQNFYRCGFNLNYQEDIIEWEQCQSGIDLSNKTCCVFTQQHKLSQPLHGSPFACVKVKEEGKVAWTIPASLGICNFVAPATKTTNKLNKIQQHLSKNQLEIKETLSKFSETNLPTLNRLKKTVHKISPYDIKSLEKELKDSSVDSFIKEQLFSLLRTRVSLSLNYKVNHRRQTTFRKNWKNHNLTKLTLAKGATIAYEKMNYKGAKKTNQAKSIQNSAPAETITHLQNKSNVICLPSNMFQVNNTTCYASKRRLDATVETKDVKQKISLDDRMPVTTFGLTPRDPSASCILSGAKNEQQKNKKITTISDDIFLLKTKCSFLMTCCHLYMLLAYCDAMFKHKVIETYSVDVFAMYRINLSKISYESLKGLVAPPLKARKTPPKSNSP